nr:hypothetical protein [Candidatus Njordarchaeum guaymaensis]
MKKYPPLNLLKQPKTKKKLLQETYNTFLDIVRETLSSVDGVKSRGQLHRKTYKEFRDKHNAASQPIIEAASHARFVRTLCPHHAELEVLFPASQFVRSSQ